MTRRLRKGSVLPERGKGLRGLRRRHIGETRCEQGCAVSGQPRSRGMFQDEHGFTTTGMVLALLITLSLIFMSAQVYRVNSASAEVQDVADAAALAAETQVGEYVLVARLCDAVVLSLSLTGLVVLGLGIAALCTPFTASLSVGLIKASRTIIQVRDRFSDRAVQVLDKLQRALPYYAAACAAAVAGANDASHEGASYLGAALLLPTSGSVDRPEADDTADDLLKDVEENADEIRRKAEEAEEAAKEANRSKERAFARDCGDQPEYCMYERAAHLAGLGGSENPLFASVDAWSFSVALQRAQAYYHARAVNESPADASLAEQARSSLRARFYRFAERELQAGYVHEGDGSFEAYFPHLPQNTAEMRLTVLYTSAMFPVTEDEDGNPVMHAWPGCPEAAATLELGSIAQMEAGDYATCPVCEFTAASMGNVAAASTSIPNGFEYHYDAVANEAAVYQEARHRADGPKSEVEDRVGDLLDQLSEVLSSLAGKRISVEPPGRYGAVALVVNAGSTPAAGPFASGFVDGDAALGPRAAIAASTLLDEGSDEGSTIISSMLDGLDTDGGVLTGAAGIVLDCWSWMLSAYSSGQDAITGGIESGLNALPLVGESGLGTWVADKLRSAIESIGLEPVELGALKPVLVNSAHVAAKDDGAFGSRLVSIQQAVYSHPLMSTDLFGSLLSGAEQEVLSRVESLGEEIQIATIDLLGDGGGSIPITIALPEAVQDTAVSTISGIFARLRSFYAEFSGVHVWE